MQNVQRVITRLSSISLIANTSRLRVLNENTKDALQNGAVIHLRNGSRVYKYATSHLFSSTSRGDGENDGEGEWGKTVAGTFGDSTFGNLGWDSVSSWSTGITKDHFDGEVAGHRSSDGDKSHSTVIAEIQNVDDNLKEWEAENKRSKAVLDGWGNRMQETTVLLKQVREPGARGSYLKDSEKAEMYRLHKENPAVNTVEKLAKDYRIMRQRVHAILWLKELEEEEEKKLGRPLDDSVELLLDAFPEFFNSHDREFHVASLPYKPDFKVMPEGWDGTTRDLDEVHYEISQKEDEMLYEEFVQKMNFNKKKMAGEVFRHKYSRRRPSNGWNFTVEKMGPRGKRGGGGGWKFVSIADGSSRPLNEMEKMYVKRETPRRRRKILP
ncbi:protein GAMETE CELL DEFECTIVE 1, mitochondrial [Humulus lupulus]|uniref:protein GAMETE CELL DEFECTIVE 1, mitochondrial n=1 Tax=Humulus lupulus TaxID=3486 RepID=UPI002B40E389|nr:protein GAMETE CELL DEFECTIVE 1, mitochondrial [Humulus lupulus]XP_062100678.1 protein GAMETE CELL DEFECTIVE 1, mitochondrial [Humulus lupulus]XP_062100686.1 protein GAMETE CELL DEFECTIVE 1, mitochondrial [Humulus lupulus]XP_062100692.1 protein GAMETE CELL DEFECTIVE 1, mitochondrial [Humulus lupulus]